MFEVKQYKHDDEELLDYIKHLLGSDLWYKEHKQSLRRREGKIFYLLFVDGEFVSMLSKHKGMYGDGFTFPKHRGKGYYSYLRQAVGVKPGEKAASSNPVIWHILETKLGMRYLYNRGQYRYYIKDGDD